jgi:hypothetical protein
MMMTAQEARKVFDQAIEEAHEKGNPDSVARLELAREYFTNPTFREALEDYTYDLNTR